MMKQQEIFHDWQFEMPAALSFQAKCDWVIQSKHHAMLAVSLHAFDVPTPNYVDAMYHSDHRLLDAIVDIYIRCPRKKSEPDFF